MAWSYCRKCDYTFDQPTAVEDLRDGQFCPRCGTQQNNGSGKTVEEWVIDIDERLRKISKVRYPNEAPMFDSSGMMLDDKGERSIFDDIDD